MCLTFLRRLRAGVLALKKEWEKFNYEMPFIDSPQFVPDRYDDSKFAYLLVANCNFSFEAYQGLSCGKLLNQLASNAAFRCKISTHKKEKFAIKFVFGSLVQCILWLQYTVNLLQAMTASTGEMFTRHSPQRSSPHDTFSKERCLLLSLVRRRCMSWWRRSHGEPSRAGWNQVMMHSPQERLLSLTSSALSAFFIRMVSFTETFVRLTFLSTPTETSKLSILIGLPRPRRIVSIQSG